jgi:tripartite-type tricarboxylate transporter receptor subunit TctC
MVAALDAAHRRKLGKIRRDSRSSFKEWKAAMRDARLAMLIVMGLSSAIIAELPAIAQTYPRSSVKIIVSIPPGGVGDVVTRLVSQQLQTAWKVPVVVENRPGGNAAIAAQAVARSAPDGHTFLVAPDAAFTSSPFLSINKLPYSLDEFTPITVLVRLTPVLAVNASLPVKTVEDLVALSKSRPGSLSYGSFGTYTHLSMEDFKQRTGADLLHVPYRGSGPAITDLLSGQISAVFASLSTVEEHAKAGSLRIIAAATKERLPDYSDLPTVADSGIANFETSAWFGLFGPANMPTELAERVRDDVSLALATPESIEFFRKNTIQRIDMPLAGFARLIRRDAEHWGALIKSIGLKLD